MRRDGRTWDRLNTAGERSGETERGLSEAPARVTGGCCTGVLGWQGRKASGPAPPRVQKTTVSDLVGREMGRRAGQARGWGRYCARGQWMRMGNETTDSGWRARPGEPAASRAGRTSKASLGMVRMKGGRRQAPRGSRWGSGGAGGGPAKASAACLGLGGLISAA